MSQLDRTCRFSRLQEPVCESICTPCPIDNHLSSKTVMTDLHHLAVDGAVNGGLARHRFVEIGMRQQDLLHFQSLAHDLDEVTHIIRVLGKNPDA